MWKLYDDSVVRDLSESNPISQIGASAYLLFYVSNTHDKSTNTLLNAVSNV